jgi:Phage integrase, N-terminal SAM-like domain
VGSIRKTAPTRRCPSGRWEARWYGPDGRQRTKVFDTSTAAKTHVRLIEADKHRGDYIDPNLTRTPFRKVAEAWLATRPAQKERTRIGYTALLRNHVLPALGDKPINRITKTTIREFIGHLEAKGAGPGTIRNVVRNVLKPALDLAVDDQMLRANPCAGVRLRASPREAMLFLTASEVAALAAEIIPARYGLLVTFAAYTGLRAGEVAALRVKHLDLMRGRLTVAESASEVPGQGLVYGPTKTYAVRTLAPSELHDRSTSRVCRPSGNGSGGLGFPLPERQAATPRKLLSAPLQARRTSFAATPTSRPQVP